MHSTTTVPRTLSAPLNKALAILSLILTLPSTAHGLDAVALQKEFAAARNLVLINAASALPADVRKTLDHIPWLRTGMAEFGASWSMGDATLEPQLAQHLFSATSDRLVAVIFQTGGIGIHQRVLLAYRYAPEYCLFDLGKLTMDRLTLQNIQQLLRPDRYQMPVPPQCEMQSTLKEYQSGGLRRE